MQSEQFVEETFKGSLPAFLAAFNSRKKLSDKEIDEIHRKDIRAIKEEYQEQIAFLKEQLKAWQTRHQ